LHGASASHLTFMTPDGGLARWLMETGEFDPWMLDWRGSGRVVDDQQNRDTLRAGVAYTFNLAAEYDVPLAVKRVCHETGYEKIAALGFCMGGGILAESIALGHITAKHLDSVVLMALGLFYETAIDGRLKCEERLLERLKRNESQDCGRIVTVDPRKTP